MDDNVWNGNTLIISGAGLVCRSKNVPFWLAAASMHYHCLSSLTKLTVLAGFLVCSVYAPHASGVPAVDLWSNKEPASCKFSNEPTKTALCNRVYWCKEAASAVPLTYTPQDPQLIGDNLCRTQGNSFFSYANRSKACLNGEAREGLSSCPNIPKNLGDNACAAAGNPVNVGIGNKFQAETDYLAGIFF